MSAARWRRCGTATSSRSTSRSGRCSSRCREAEIARRLAEWVPPDRTFLRGYNRMYAAHITQADKGCDFDFLEGTEPTPEPEIH